MSAEADAVLDTIIAHLAVLFLTGAKGDIALARRAAAHAITTYCPESEAEIRLAARAVSFGFHALEALCQAATPDMPMNKILRLRSGAVSLNREAEKAERHLAQAQQARRDGATDHPQADPPSPKAEKAAAFVAATRSEIHPTQAGTPAWQKPAAARKPATAEAAPSGKPTPAATPAPMPAPAAAATPTPIPVSAMSFAFQQAMDMNDPAAVEKSIQEAAKLALRLANA